MFISRKLAVMAAALVLCLPLAACGNDGPSDSEVKQVVRQELQNADIILNMAEQENPATLNKMEIDVGTKTKQPDGSFDVVVTIEGQTRIVKLVKGSNGWQAMDDNVGSQ